MSVNAGTRLGPYEIVTVIGASRISAWKMPLVVIPNKVRNSSSVQTLEKRDSSACSMPRNDKSFFSADGWSAAIHLIDGPACGGFSDSLRKGVLLFLYAKKLFHHCLLVAKQGINLCVALPTCCVGLRVIDGELQG